MAVTDFDQLGTFLPLRVIPQEQAQSEPEITEWDTTTQLIRVLEQVVQPPSAEQLAGIVGAPEITPDHTNWPNLTFTFSHSALTGSELIAASRDSRVRTVVNAIGAVTPTSLYKPDNLSPGQALKAAHDNLKKSFTDKGESHAHLEVLDLNLALGGMELFLAYYNDPVTQALAQVKQQYGHQLAAADLAQLRIDTLLSAKQFTVKRIYSEYAQRYRQGLRLGKKVSEMLVLVARS